MNSNHGKLKRWRPKWSVRLLLILLTLLCAYLACWQPTIHRGVHDVDEYDARHVLRLFSTRIDESLESPVAPLIVESEDRGLRRYYFWFFGYVAKLPYDRGISSRDGPLVAISLSKNGEPTSGLDETEIIGGISDENPNEGLSIQLGEFRAASHFGDTEADFPKSIGGIVSQVDEVAVVNTLRGDFGLCRKLDYASGNVRSVILFADRDFEIPLSPRWLIAILVIAGMAVVASLGATGFLCRRARAVVAGRCKP